MGGTNLGLVDMVVDGDKFCNSEKGRDRPIDRINRQQRAFSAITSECGTSFPLLSAISTDT